jgi:DNA-binding response OmpR family regulator
MADLINLADERIRVDLEAEQVYVDGQANLLSPLPSKVVALLASKPDHPFAGSLIGESIWGHYDSKVDQNLRQVIFKAKRQLGTELAPVFRTIKEVGISVLTSLDLNQCWDENDQSIKKGFDSRVALDPGRWLVRADGTHVHLKTAEFRILNELLGHTSGGPLSSPQLAEVGSTDPQNVRSYVSHINRKLMAALVPPVQRPIQYDTMGGYYIPGSRA